MLKHLHLRNSLMLYLGEENGYLEDLLTTAAADLSAFYNV